MISITVDARGAIHMLDRLGESIPRVTQQGIKEVAELGAQELVSAVRRRVTHPGSIPQSIRAKRMGAHAYGVTLSQKGYFRSEGQPHYVAVKRGRNIATWVRKYYGSQVKTGLSRVHRGPRGGLRFNSSGSAGAIYTTPTPFIREAFNNTLKKAKPIVEKHINRTVQTKGR